MSMRKNVAAVALAVGLLGTATVGTAAVAEIEIRTAPPPDRVEIVPAPREGFIYERGHYNYDGRQYVWTEGNDEAALSRGVWRTFTETNLRYSQAASQLPPEVVNQGVTVKKSTTSPLGLFVLSSPKGTYDQLFLSNYAYVNINDPMTRVPGVGQVLIFGAAQYAIRF